MPRKTSTAGPKVQCRQCGDIIQSMYSHDFVWCKCKAIAIDGGAFYNHCTGSPHDFIWLKEPVTKRNQKRKK